MIGSLVKLGAGLVTAFNTVLGMFRDKSLQDQGAETQRGKDAQELLQEVEEQNRHAGDPVPDRVRQLTFRD